MPRQGQYGRPILRNEHIRLLSTKGVETASDAWDILHRDVILPDLSDTTPLIDSTEMLHAVTALSSQTQTLAHTADTYHLAVKHPCADEEIVNDAVRFLSIHSPEYFHTPARLTKTVLTSPHLSPGMFNWAFRGNEFMIPTARDIAKMILNHPYANPETVNNWTHSIISDPNRHFLAPIIASPTWRHTHLLTDEDKSRLLIISAVN